VCVCVRVWRGGGGLSHNTYTHVSLFTGLDYWTGLMDWTTGLSQTGINGFFTVGDKLVQHLTTLNLLP